MFFTTSAPSARICFTVWSVVCLLCFLYKLTEQPLQLYDTPCINQIIVFIFFISLLEDKNRLWLTEQSGATLAMIKTQMTS